MWWKWKLVGYAVALEFLFFPSAISNAWTHGSVPTRPCDIVVCAEAHSLTRAMTSSYHGPLFQISKGGGATLDIGLDANGRADMTTWSAFCGGVQANCWLTKIYAQIHITSNDVANYFGPFNGNALFSIEPATGLPIAIVPPTVPFNIPGNGSDVAAVGINGHNNPVSVYYVGRFDALAHMCCGVYGIYHLVTEPNTPGTDFGIMPTYGRSGFSLCSTSTVYCLQIDEEINVDGGDVGPSPIDFVGVVTYDPAGSGAIAGYTNNHATFSKSPPSIALDPGTAIHLFSGGDMTADGTAIMREGFISNSTLTAGQVASLTANAAAFYSGVSFP